MGYSELVPHLGQVADEITLIRSVHWCQPSHPSVRSAPGRPQRTRRAGCFSLARLAARRRNCRHVALTDTRGLPLIGGEVVNDKLPSIYQGTMVRPVAHFNLDPPRHLEGSPQEEQLRLLDRMNATSPTASRRERPRGAHESYGLAAHAGGSAGGVRHLPRIGGHENVRHHQKVTRDYGTLLIARRLSSAACVW